MSDRTQKLEEFKTEIRSLLTSLPHGSPINRICKDYRDFIGRDVPFRELGYQSAINLLNAIPDAVNLRPYGNDIYAFVVCNENIAHIAEMVSRQKKPTSGYAKSDPGRNRPRRPGQSPRYSRPILPAKQPTLPLPRCVPQSLKLDLKILMEAYPNGMNVDQLKIAFRRKFGVDLNHQDFDFVRIADFVKSLASDNIIRIQENSNSMFILPVHCKANRSNSEVHEEKIQNNGDTGRKNNYDVNAKVYDNLLKVVSRFPDGFPLTLLSDNYKEVTGSTLDYKELGYNNVQELINDLDIFRVTVMRTGEWILTDASLPAVPDEPSGQVQDCADENGTEIPDNIQQNIYDLLQNSTEGILLSEFERVYLMNFHAHIPWRDLQYSNLRSMLMALEFHSPIRFVKSGLNDLNVMFMPKDNVTSRTPVTASNKKTELTVPEDAVVLGQVFIAPKVPPKDDQYFPVVVSSVESPGKIWLQLVSNEEARNDELEVLMDDLSDFYQSPEGDRYKIPDKYLMNSMNCAVVYPEDQTWHRGSIIGKPGPTTYEVFYYDYGTICVIEKELLRLLRKEFSVLPAQAFSARLAHVAPLHKFYSVEASRKLLGLVSGNKPFMAQITSKTFMNTTSVILCDTSGDNDIFLNDFLIKESLVQNADDFIELRAPYVVSSPDIIPSTPSPTRPSIAGLDARVELGKVPVGVTPSMLFNPPPGIERPSDIHGLFPHKNIMQTPSDSKLYQPPSLSNLNPSDPDVVKRLGDNILAKKRLQNVPQAAVGPLQMSNLQSSYINRQAIVPLSPVTARSENLSRFEQQYPEQQNVESPQQEDLYESSREDDGQQDASVWSGNSCQLTFCKKVDFREADYTAHLINFYGKPCFTSADVSSFVFGVDIIKKILQIQKYPPCHTIVSRQEHPALFADLEHFSVRGFTSDDDKTDKVIIYLLSDVVKILKFLNHNKQTLVEDIEEFHNNFDKKDTYWTTKHDTSDDLPNTTEALLAQLNRVKEERKALLRTMLGEDASSSQQLEQLVSLDKEITRRKYKLSKLGDQIKSKSAGEEARKFLDRLRIDKDSVSSATPTPVEQVTTAPAISNRPTTGVTIQTGALLTSGEGLILANRNNIPPHAYSSTTVLPGLTNPAALPVHLASPYFPNSFVYQQMNTSYPVPMRFPTNFNSPWP